MFRDRVFLGALMSSGGDCKQIGRTLGKDFSCAVSSHRNYPLQNKIRKSAIMSKINKPIN
jgi:hypothetical protein